MRWFPVLLVLALAGCSGQPVQDTVEGQEAASANHQAASKSFDYALFLGLTGTEGDLDWAAYEEALLAATDPGATIAEAFDQDVDNGEPGDGRLGSWLTTHFVFDEERNLLGGLYTQYLAGEGPHGAMADFRGPYAGTTSLPQLAPRAPGMPVDAIAQAMAFQQDEVLCTLLSSLEEMHTNSHEAARVASQQPLFQEFVAANPGGEYTYYYFPQLGVEEDCAAELTIQSNYWVVSYTDLDRYLAGESTTVAEVRIDAATGEVLDESVRPLFERPPMVLVNAFDFTDPLVPTTRSHTNNISMIVTPDVARLTVEVTRIQAPSGAIDAETRLKDPYGLVVETRSFADPSHTYTVREPTPGAWQVEYVYKSLEPAGEHRLGLRTTMAYG